MATPTATAAPAPAATPRAAPTVAATPAATPTPAATALATPGVRALARERGLPLETLAGSGYKGSITREDVLAATSDARAGNQYGEVERRPLSATRRAIASRLGAAAASAVYVSAMAEFDVSELAAFRKRGAELLAKSELHLTYLPFILKALGLALKLHPALNAEFDEARGELLLKHYLNIGIAVDGPEGLLVPVIRDVDRKSPVDLARELGDLARRARDRRLTPAELRGSSFTVSNYGAFGGRFATPVPNHPDVAILGTGVIGERPWVVDGALAVRTVIPLSLTFDHRVADGGEATRFLAEIGRLLADPAALLLELR
ncbi:MAG TPA: dihydrolipoamide acetyltransferase family protein [Rectinemataceae bacterium]|nr:dihydrolipoamide acetyltransferase family protein [Rectinemataceae bacterium]